MKTADLIPFILLELADCDKYGFELTKNIETKSNGKIVIKQPTLYTLLKKLEKSKFITSYWQDSEIGGKRHYYKLTENGKMQVSTLPSYDFLMKSTLEEDVDESEIIMPHAESNFSFNKEEKPISIMDELLNQNIATPKESIITSNEVFNDDNLDSATEFDVNLTNTNVLKNENVSKDEEFATNQDVTTFTSKMAHNPVIMNSIENKVSTKNDILNGEFSAPHNDLDIQYVDYEDFKNSKKNKYAKKIISKRLLQILATCGSLLLILSLCEIITIFTSHSAFYYFCFIPSILVLIFYPVIYTANMEKLRLKYQNCKFQIKTKQRIFIGLFILLIVIIASIIVSINSGKTTINSILSIDNFANLYAPILMFSTYFLDTLFIHLLVLKINNQEF